jgi:hypothetical protein
LDDRAVFGADGRVARLGGNLKRQHLDVIESLTPRTKEDHNPSRYFPSAFDEGAKPLQMASIDLPAALTSIAQYSASPCMPPSSVVEY